MFESNRIKIWPIFHLCCTRPSICISVLIYLTRSYWALGFILYSPWIFCCCRQPCDSSICSEKSVSSFTKKSFDRKVGEMCAFLLVPVPWKIHPINQHFPRLPCQTRMKKKSDHLDEVHGKYFLSKAYTTWKIYFVASVLKRAQLKPLLFALFGIRFEKLPSLKAIRRPSGNWSFRHHLPIMVY